MTQISPGAMSITPNSVTKRKAPSCATMSSSPSASEKYSSTIARGGEGRARELLGVEAVVDLLRRVAADRQGAGQRLGLEAVAEARHVARHQAFSPCSADLRRGRVEAGHAGDEAGQRVGDGAA